MWEKSQWPEKNIKLLKGKTNHKIYELIFKMMQNANEFELKLLLCSRIAECQCSNSNGKYLLKY